jgi:hypothetical protein
MATTPRNVLRIFASLAWPTWSLSISYLYDADFAKNTVYLNGNQEVRDGRFN